MKPGVDGCGRSFELRAMVGSHACRTEDTTKAVWRPSPHQERRGVDRHSGRARDRSRVRRVRAVPDSGWARSERSQRRSRGGRLVAGPAGVLRDKPKPLQMKRFCASRRMHLSGCPPHRGARAWRELGCDPALRGLPEIGMLRD